MLVHLTPTPYFPFWTEVSFIWPLLLPTFLLQWTEFYLTITPYFPFFNELSFIWPVLPTFPSELNFIWPLHPTFPFKMNWVLLDPYLLNWTEFVCFSCFCLFVFCFVLVFCFCFCTLVNVSRFFLYASQRVSGLSVKLYITHDYRQHGSRTLWPVCMKSK